MITMNRANKTTGYVKISQGGIVGTVVDIRLIMKFALESLSTGIVICHNHPSGNLNPSNEDVNLTKKISDACKMFEITLFDHVILTKESYYSFADNGML